jgi:hypothetical protein
LIEEEINYLKTIRDLNASTDKSENLETKTDKLKYEIGKYAFFNLSMVNKLSEPNKQKLVELLSANGLPYSIAMFEYLGFLKYLKDEYTKTDYRLFKLVARWFDVNDRTVKGNVGVLNDKSKEDRKRYTADKHKQTVINHYQQLK